MPRSRIPKEEIRPLASYINRILAVCQVKPYPFSQKYEATYGVTHSTIKDVSRALTTPKRETLRRLALALGDELAEAAQAGLVPNLDKVLLGDSAIEINEGDPLSRTIYQVMDALLPIEELEPLPRKPPETRELSVSDIYHFYEHNLDLLGHQDQIFLVSKITAKNARVIDRWANSVPTAEGDAMQLFIEAIQRNMAAFDATTPQEYAANLFKALHYAPEHPDVALFLKGIETILNDREIPETDAEEFGTTMGYLAANLEDGKYQGDVGLMLADLIFGTKQQQAQAGSTE